MGIFTDRDDGGVPDSDISSTDAGDAGDGAGDAGDSAAGDGDVEPWQTPTKVELVFTAGTTESDHVGGIGLDSNGNVIVGGYSRGDFDLGVCRWTNQGDMDAYVASFTPQGECLWLIGFGGSEQDNVYNLTVAQDGMIYAVGMFRGTATIGEETLLSIGPRDSFLMAINPNGEVAWVRHFGSAGVEGQGFMRVTTDDENNPIITGYMQGSVDFGDGLVTPPGYAQDLIIVSYSPDSQLLFAYNFGGINQEQGQYISTDSNGAVVICGEFTNETNFGQGAIVSEGDEDVFVVRVDTQGDLVWQNTIGGPGKDEAGGVVVLGNNQLVFGGIFTESVDFETETLVSAGGADGFIHAVDGSGDALWVVHVAGAIEEEMVFELVETPDGRISAIGTFTQEATIGDETLEGMGDHDIFWALIDSHGQVDATQVISSVSWDGVGDMYVGPEGEIYIGGSFSNATDFGTDSRIPIGYSDIFVVRLVP